MYARCSNVPRVNHLQTVLLLMIWHLSAAELTHLQANGQTRMEAQSRIEQLKVQKQQVEAQLAAKAQELLSLRIVSQAPLASQSHLTTLILHVALIRTICL